MTDNYHGWDRGPRVAFFSGVRYSGYWVDYVENLT